MTSTSTPPFGPDFVKELISLMMQKIEESTKQTYHMMWDVMMNYLAQHWVAVLFAVFVIAFVRAFVTGRWAMLGSVVYNYLYFGTLFVVGNIFGADLFANDYFKIILVILYVVCFILTGKFLTKIGVRRF